MGLLPTSSQIKFTLPYQFPSIRSFPCFIDEPQILEIQTSRVTVGHKSIETIGNHTHLGFGGYPVLSAESTGYPPNPRWV